MDERLQQYEDLSDYESEGGMTTSPVVKTGQPTKRVKAIVVQYH